MKKSIFLAALMLVTGMALTGCSDSTEPRLQAPTGTFELYEPAYNNFTYDLTNPLSTMTLTTSGQPDYGVAVPTSYQVQVSFNPNAEEWVGETIDPETGEVIEWGNYYSLPSVNTQSVISVNALELNQAITYLQGIHDPEEVNLYDPSPCSLYVRVRAYVADLQNEEGYVSYSQVFSNVIKINSVQPKPEASLPIPASLYIIGDYQGWNIDGNAQTRTVTEEEYGIGSDIYTGYLQISSGQYFRFYSELGNWDNNSIGAKVEDEATEIEFDKNGSFTGKCLKGKGSWTITNADGGWVKLTVDLNSMEVTFEQDPDYSE